MSKYLFFSRLLLAGYFACSSLAFADEPHGAAGRAAGSAQSGVRGGFHGGPRPGYSGYGNRGYGRNWGQGGHYWHHRWYPGYVGLGIYGLGYPYYSGSYYPYDSPFAYYGDTPYYGYSYYPQPVGSSEAAVQAELAQRGYYHGPIDGILGPASYRAIRAFQAAHGLPPTGQVDSNLLRALRR
jgi:hypothetical protein